MHNVQQFPVLGTTATLSQFQLGERSCSSAILTLTVRWVLWQRFSCALRLE